MACECLLMITVQEGEEGREEKREEEEEKYYKAFGKSKLVATFQSSGWMPETRGRHRGTLKIKVYDK